MQPIYELGGRFAVGEKFYVGVLLRLSTFLIISQTPLNGAEPVPFTQDPDDVIVKVTPIAVAISWSAINQSVSSRLSIPERDA